MINSKTRLVVIPHVSNILGNILDIKTIVKKIREKNCNTKIIVDGVAYMAHGIIDVTDLDVDFYIVSFYKFCGLRISALYIRDTLVLSGIENQNHYFIANDENEDLTKKLEIGGINYENLISINGLSDYLCDVAKVMNYNEFYINDKEIEFNRELYEFVMNNICEYEKFFIEAMTNNFISQNEITIIEDKRIKKTPLFSLKFTNFDVKYVEIILNSLNIVCKCGQFYSNRLLKNIEVGDVLRLSFMHYNNSENIHKIVYYLNMFKRLELDFVLNLDMSLYNCISDDLKKSFNNLIIDSYYKEKRNRGFSLLNIGNPEEINIVGDIDFYQSSSYNNYNGDIIRKYANIDIALLQDKSFKYLVNKFKTEIENAVAQNISVNNGYDKYNTDYIFVHQIRVYASQKNNVNLVPEGIHRDGYNIIGMCVINRVNISGGKSNIYDNEKNLVLSKELKCGEFIILNDAKMYHDVTPIDLDNVNEEGYRDIFVFTSIS